MPLNNVKISNFKNSGFVCLYCTIIYKNENYEKKFNIYFSTYRDTIF